MTGSHKGSELFGMEYEPLFDFAAHDKKAYYVVHDGFVTLDDGTGIVHTAPAFGEDDAKVGRQHDLPFVQLVNDQGEFVEAVEPWKGMFVKTADPLIIKDLESRGWYIKSWIMSIHILSAGDATRLCFTMQRIHGS